MPTRDEIAKQALALPPDDRAFLADLLEHSLNGSGPSDEELTAAWTAEIERRIGQLDRGEVEAIDAQTAMEQLRAGLAERRAKRGA